MNRKENKKSCRKYPVIAIIAVFFIFAGNICGAVSCRAAEGGTGEHIYSVSVFQTSDIHGYLADISHVNYQYRLAFIADKVRDKRTFGGEYDPKRAILLDAGDIYEGNILSEMFEGMTISAAFDLMDYDAVTIGNHEFDQGIGSVVDADGTMMDYELQGTEYVNSVPVVISNLYQNGEQVDFAEDYVILHKTAVDKEGNEISVNIAVIGFADEYSTSVIDRQFEEEGFEIRPDYDRVNTIAAELEDSRACDATILLTHGDASVIATGLGDGSVIDLVLGGHTHKSILGETPWDMIYLEPSAKASAYTYAELWFTLEEESVRFERVANAHVVTVTDNISQLYDLPKNEEELDPQVFALSETAISAAESVNKEIGYITVDAVKYLNGQDNDGRDSTCGNWMASITARAVGADVGFINVGGIRTDLKIPKGQDRRYITAADLSAVFPFKNLIYCYEITYEDLLELLEYAVTGSGASLLSQMTGITCYYKDNKVESIVTDGGEAIYENGTWTVDPKETIRIALSEFIATTDRKEKDMSNPLISWNETDRLISTDVTDVEGALTVLTEEAAENDGYLYIDEGKHFVSLD